MTIRFAPANQTSPITGMVIRALRQRDIPNFANDNGAPPANDEILLAQTLRHFGSHGMRAAGLAAQTARTAYEMGDATGVESWLSICRMLDRRLAYCLEREFASGI